MTTPVTPVALTIAGSDSGGGAGIQADLATFAACSVHGTSVVTLVTAQNTLGIQASEKMRPEIVAAQLDAVLADLPPAAVKTGALASAPIVELLAQEAAAGRLPNLVVDPVRVTTAGEALIDAAGEAALRECLLPHATIATPNLHEAGWLIGQTLHSARDIRAVADELLALGPKAIIVTGGHIAGDPVDLLITDSGVMELSGIRVQTTNDHGTGCTYSAAVCARLAHGDDLAAAATYAQRFTMAALRRSVGWTLGAGRGPVAHTEHHVGISALT